MTPEDLAALRRAVRSLEHPGLAASLTNMVGKPIELIGNALPAFRPAGNCDRHLQSASRRHSRWHCGLCRGLIPLDRGCCITASGAAGGAFGLATLPVELPVSTIIMLRSIAEIARSHGEDPSDPESALSCIQVFALGGRAGSADASETGYFAVRGMLAKSVTEAARFIAERGIVEEGAPVLVRFITLVASRFGVVLTQKFAAQALPLVGALGGASVNYVFIEHFSGDGSGSFHRSQAGTNVRKGHCTG
jgi:hypothetical protein